MKAVILAGGLGNRLKPFTEVIPKPLLPIGEKSILEIQMERLKKHGFNEIFLCTNFKSDYIRNFFGDGSRYGIKLTVSKEEESLGTAGPINLIKDRLQEPFIVMNGDILSLIDFTKFYKFALDKKTMLTLAIKKEITPYAFGNIFFNEDYVTGIQEKPDIITYILAGIYVMTPDIFKYIPENKYFGMDSLIQDLLEKRNPIAKYELSEYWLDIGRLNDYEKAEDAYNSHFKELKA
jgi:NDP-sugar pyrophosphorylase family protein